MNEKLHGVVSSELMCKATAELNAQTDKEKSVADKNLGQLLESREDEDKNTEE